MAFKSFVSALGIVTAGLILSISLSAQTYTTVFTFPENKPPAPSQPNSTLVEVTPGVFYGTAQFGGPDNCGSIFSISSAGQFRNLHNFSLSSEGCLPEGKLIQAVDGYLYGILSGIGEGGPSGKMFRSDLDGNVSIVADFTFPNGETPIALAATAAPDGSIYAVIELIAIEEGAEPAGVGSYLFRYDPLTGQSVTGTPYFTNQEPTPLIAASDGNLYGAFPGLLFKVSSAADFEPVAGLPRVSFSIVTALGQGSNGLLYLATTDWLAGQSYILSMDLTGHTLETVQTFSYATACDEPVTGFTPASDGSLYAGCLGGSPSHNAVIYKITASSVYQITYESPDYNAHLASLSGLAVQGLDGILYGEVESKSHADPGANGSIYAFNPGLPLPAPAITTATPASGSLGTSVILFGDHFLGATGVTVDGVSAPFTVNSNSYLTITVPQGASSGSVVVTTPHGAGKAASAFTVTP